MITTGHECTNALFPAVSEFYFCPKQEEMCRIEEEQSFEELKILRELVHDRFYKQEELAEVRNLRGKGHLFPAHPEPFGVDMLVLLSGHMATHAHHSICHGSSCPPLCDYTESSRASV